MLRPALLSAAIACALAASDAPAAEAETPTGTLPTVEVTTSKFAETVDQVPAMVTVVSGDEMRARGVVVLQSQTNSLCTRDRIS